MKYLLILLFNTVIVTNSYADGLDDPKFYQRDEVLIEPKSSPNYYRHFNKHPCWYDDTLSCYQHTEYSKPTSNQPHHKHNPPQQVPEPSTLLLLSVSGIGLWLRSRKL